MHASHTAVERLEKMAFHSTDPLHIWLTAQGWTSWQESSRIIDHSGVALIPICNDFVTDLLFCDELIGLRVRLRWLYEIWREIDCIDEMEFGYTITKAKRI
jgi:hypothetical protein